MFDLTRRVAAVITVSGLLVLQGAVAEAQQLGLGNQMTPPYTTYSPTFPTYQPAPVIGGYTQTYNPSPAYNPLNPPPVSAPSQSYPSYLAPGAGCIGRIGPGC